jgi:hypothetical protein
MGLLIYETVDPSAAFSIGNDYSNPIAHSFDGVTGAVLIRRFFVRNDDPTKSYLDIQIQPIYVNGDNIIDGTGGFSWKLISGDQEPLKEQWELVSPANLVDIPDIGTGVSSDIATYEPFWLRIEVPQGASVKSHEGIKLRVIATEVAI